VKEICKTHGVTGSQYSILFRTPEEKRTVVRSEMKRIIGKQNVRIEGGRNSRSSARGLMA
jgi:hypothetical protein